MAVLSKLFLSSNEPMHTTDLALTECHEQTVHHRDYFDDHLDVSISHPPHVIYASDFDIQHGSVPGNVFANRLIYINTALQSRTSHGYGQPVSRPPKPPPVYVWYCHECGDGPISTWRGQCNCEHHKCEFCKEEQTR